MVPIEIFIEYSNVCLKCYCKLTKKKESIKVLSVYRNRKTVLISALVRVFRNMNMTIA